MIPPLRDFLGRIVTSVLARVVLLLLGYFWIPVEKVSLKRTACAHLTRREEERQRLTLLADALLLRWLSHQDAAT